MRHRVHGRTLGRKTNHRTAMWRNMAASLFMHGQITTTLPKAKSVQPLVEKIITAAKKGDLAARRRVIQALGGDRIIVRNDEDETVERNSYGEVTGGQKLVKYIVEELAPQYADRQGGYTRIIKLSKHRIGDASDLCVLMLVGTEEGDGPQIAGQFSRRRDKANKRMEFAAKLRKGDTPETPEESIAAASESEVPAEEVGAEETATAVAEAEAPATEPETSETPEASESSGDDAATEEEKKD